MQFLNEADDEDGEGDGLEGADDAEEDGGMDASAEDDSSDIDSPDDTETADDNEKSDISADDKSEKEESAPGYYIAYNLKVQGLKETALKDAMKKFASTFFDDLQIKADGLFGGGGDTLSIKQIKDSFKSVFGGIDPNKLKETIGDKLRKKFPDLGKTAEVEIRDKDTLIGELKNFKLDSKDKDKILKANYSVTIQAEKSSSAKKFLNLRTIADLVTSSISGLFKKFKNQIKKDDVILVKDYEDRD